jgi:hypothetical protein
MQFANKCSVRNYAGFTISYQSRDRVKLANLETDLVTPFGS